MNELQQDTEHFEISAVSRITGLSTHNLRVWEKRYGVVSPERSESQRRLYSREDIRRLSLLKSLVDKGHSIGTVASLSSEQLESRLHEAEKASLRVEEPSALAPGSVRRIAVVGSLTEALLQEHPELFRELELVGHFTDLAQLKKTVRSGEVDLLLVEMPTLFRDGVKELQALLDQLEARKAVVVYRFAQADTVDQIDKDLPGVTALRAPINATELRMACLADFLAPRIPLPESQPGLDADQDEDQNFQPPPRIFNDRQLVEISRITSSIQCECPQHLASLLSSLAAFESYSQECENRNEEDAKLHRYLHRVTARARSSMEQALIEVLEADGIELGP